MAKTGVKFLTIAPITSYADGAKPVYGEKVSVEYTVSLNINFEYASAEMYGDDMLRESDRGMTGYSIAGSLTDLNPEVCAVALGWKKGSDNSYSITDANPPYVGGGYVTNGMVNGVRYYEGVRFYRAQFTKDAMNASTKERNVTFNADDITGTGMGVILDDSGAQTFVQIERFAAESDAKDFSVGHLTA